MSVFVQAHNQSTVAVITKILLTRRYDKYFSWHFCDKARIRYFSSLFGMKFGSHFQQILSKQTVTGSRELRSKGTLWTAPLGWSRGWKDGPACELPRILAKRRHSLDAISYLFPSHLMLWEESDNIALESPSVSPGPPSTNSTNGESKVFAQ